MPRFGRKPSDDLSHPVVSSQPLRNDAPRVPVRDQAQLRAAVADGAVPRVAGRGPFFVGSGVLIETDIPARVHAIGDARVVAGGAANVTVGGDVTVTLADDARGVLLGSASATLRGGASARVATDARQAPFPDGSIQPATGVRAQLYDDATLESFAPTEVTARDTSTVLLHGKSVAQTVTLLDRAHALVHSSAQVTAGDFAYVTARGGQVTASGDVIVTAQALDDPAGPQPPTVQATASAVVVSDGHCEVSGPRLLTAADVADPQTWLALWGLESEDGGVLVTLVRPDDGSVMLPNWEQVHLRDGDKVTRETPVVTRKELWGWRERTAGRVLQIHVPLSALHTGRHLGELHRARVTGGRVVAP
jgi:hypothetical protein